MAITTTTLRAALSATNPYVSLVDATHVVKRSVLRIEAELCEVVLVGPIFTRRGGSATGGVAHAAGTTVQVGLASDFTQANLSAIAAGDSPSRGVTGYVQDGASTVALASITY